MANSWIGQLVSAKIKVDGQEIQDEECSEVDEEEEKCEIISKEEVGSDVPGGESCSEVETDQDWETFEEVPEHC